MTQDIMEKARELAALIADTEIFKNVEIAEDAASENEELTNLFGQFAQMRQEIEALTDADEPDYDQIAVKTREMDEVQAKMKAIPVAQTMQAARDAFSELMHEVNHAMQSVLYPDQHACGGDCAGCHGCH